MIITRLEKVKDTRWKVEVDGEYWGILDAEILVKFRMKQGAEVDEDLLAEALRAAEYRRARERALYLLDYREHSRRELEIKLARNVSREVAEQVAARMQELGLLNDEAYAQRLARHYVLDKKQGARRAVLELRKKGIDARTAEEAVAAVEPEEDALLELVRRKYGRALAYNQDGKQREKAIRALMRLGHGYYDAADAVDTVLEELERESEE
ncbi:MAG: regulatory protein RecX [Candidatus Merdivicinus sp.]|jgi:regulatory protein